MRVWPRSLLGRNLVILFTLVAISQICTIAILVVFVQDPRIEDAASLEAAQIMLLGNVLSELPNLQRQERLTQMGAMPGDAFPPATHSELPRGYVARRFMMRLAAKLPADLLVRWEKSPQHRFWVRTSVGGAYRWIRLPPIPVVNHSVPWSTIGLLLMLATIPALGAYLIHRNIEGPLRRLTRAASSIERGVWPVAVSVKGPLEVAVVAEAFNRMISVLSEMEATRAEMLAGISHDLRTPLTKLRMAIAAPEAFDAPMISAERFVEEIDVIIQQFVDFARGGDSETAVPGDLNALIEQLAADYAGLGHSFSLSLAPLPPLSFRPISIQRLLMNLMQNAVNYGRTGLSVETRHEGRWIVVSVEDRGPGVPEATLLLIKQPFRRGSNAKDKRGTGLGLAITERIALQHGGRLDLQLREQGGLRALVFLPAT